MHLHEGGLLAEPADPHSVVLQVWFPGRPHPPPSGSCWKCGLGSSRKVWGGAQGSLTMLRGMLPGSPEPRSSTQKLVPGPASSRVCFLPPASPGSLPSCQPEPRFGIPRAWRCGVPVSHRHRSRSGLSRSCCDPRQLCWPDATHEVLSQGAVVQGARAEAGAAWVSPNSTF